MLLSYLVEAQRKKSISHCIFNRGMNDHITIY